MLQEVFFFRPTRRTVDSCEHEGGSVVAHRDRGRDGVALNLNILQVKNAVIPKNEDATLCALRRFLARVLSKLCSFVSWRQAMWQVVDAIISWTARHLFAEFSPRTFQHSVSKSFAAM